MLTRMFIFSCLIGSPLFAASQKDSKEPVKSTDKSKSLAKESDVSEKKETQKVLDAGSESYVVTASGEKVSKRKLSLSADRLSQADIAFVRPSHPSSLLNRSAGVHINKLAGEGHFTAIRNKMSTGADYLYLENGIPTRSTGFFNHNALYEVNVPQAGAVEVIKGPGSALYGSDAMHGVINVISGDVPNERLLKLGVEYGTGAWKRSLMTYGDRINEQHAFRFDLNLTDSEGWRDYSDYSRNSFTGQWLWTPSDDFSMKTMLTYTYVDQSQGSGLSREDYRRDPSHNYYQIPGRDVESLRISTKMTKKFGESSELSFTPYFRQSAVYGLIPSWRLSHKPNGWTNNDLSEIWDSGFTSYGAQLRFSHGFNDSWESRLVAGLDLDYSPGYNKREQTLLTRNFQPDGSVLFTDYGRTGTMIYDYDATYSSVSPYLHFETSPHETLHFDFGLRYDYARFDFENKLSGATQLADTDLSFQQLSPKIGLNWQFSDDHAFYASWRRGFRAPSANNLFSAKASVGSTELEPTTIDSYEIGVRGDLTETLHYDLTAYYMVKKDDIISYRDPNNPNQETVANNGETHHKGVELGLTWEALPELTLRTATSYAKHTYEKWDIGAAPAWAPTGPSGTELEGNELDRAPRFIANLAIDWHPIWMNGGSWELEMDILGSYWENQQNTDKYGGYELFNLRAEYPVDDHLTIYGRAMNIFDRQHSVSASSSSATQYNPGAPRSFFFGMEYEF